MMDFFIMATLPSKLNSQREGTGVIPCISSSHKKKIDLGSGRVKKILWLDLLKKGREC